MIMFSSAAFDVHGSRKWKVTSACNGRPEAQPSPNIDMGMLNSGQENQQWLALTASVISAWCCVALSYHTAQGPFVCSQ